ncbi:WRKY DNA-binding transcription factor 70 [Euphorbia peplus]|nr:WRKY DNA-binding transcription factor 70 [Euphorbia peplus]
MGSCNSENMILQNESILKQLLQGQDCAFQLQILLRKSVEDQNYSFLSSSSCDDLMLKILTSFTDPLSYLTATTTPASDEVCSKNNLLTSQVIDTDQRSEDSGESRKRPSGSATSAYHSRGSYKRKKTSNSLTKVSPIVEDSHAWRKYGQKDILNAKYPRSYFRCTHKYDQGCRATKQVQKKEDDPNLYLITYIRSHTCSDSLKIPQNNNNNDIICWEYSNCSSSSAPTLIKEETTISDQAQSNDNVLWNYKDIMTFGDQTAAIDAISFDDSVRSIDFGTHGFQYLDESEFNYIYDC